MNILNKNCIDVLKGINDNTIDACIVRPIFFNIKYEFTGMELNKNYFNKVEKTINKKLKNK